MQIIRHWQSIPQDAPPRVLAIGNFDGVHCGHQVILAALREAAARLKLPAWVMSFEPHPQAYFNPEQAPPRLLSVREKLVQLQDQGVDGVCLLRFDSVVQLKAHAFVQQLLLARLHVQQVLVGADFRFGQGRVGDVALLQALGQAAGFGVTAPAMLQMADSPVSSSRIRAALSAGNFAAATTLLGRPYTLSGRVGYGAQRGRQLGFPTLNVLLHRTAPLQGVYAVRVHGVGSQPWPAVANFGYRPTVAGQCYSLEAHLFDFTGDCYGLRVAVEPIAHLRGEQRFADLDALRAQITADARAARLLLGLSL